MKKIRRLYPYAAFVIMDMYILLVPLRNIYNVSIHLNVVE